jgi:hypothetical protein
MATAGFLLLIFSMWLSVGLLTCSVNPELSTSADHILGSVTHYICSNLISLLGVMSLSLALVFSRLGAILWSASTPQVTVRDVTVYVVFLLLTATQLQIALEIELMGAPIGGVVGLFASQGLKALGPHLAQAVVCFSIFAVLGLHMWLYQRDEKREASPPPDKWITEVHRGAQPVRSLSVTQQRVHTHVLAAVNHLPPEFDHESRRFEAVESFYDDLDGVEKAGQATVGVDEPIFSFDFDQSAHEPRLTFDSSVAADLTPARSTDARDSRVISSSHHHTAHGQLSTPGPRLANVNTLPGSQARTPIEQLSQNLTPKVSRKTILQRAFDSLQITLALINSESGNVADRYEFVSPISPPMPLYEITERLNAHIRRSLGRSEPPILLTMHNQSGRYIIEASWPRRERVFTETSQAMKIIRELESKGELTLYLGDSVGGERAFLPFVEVRSIMVTGGEKVEQDRGLDLILTNLIYQASPTKLRLLILDVASERSLYSRLPHLYAPIISDSDRMTNVLRWLPIEYRRRRGIMSRAGVQKYSDYRSINANADPRITLVIPELSHLDNEQQELLVNVIEKVSQIGIETGIHILINSRVFGERCAKFVRYADVHLAFSASSLEEARGFGVTGAEWLLPHNDTLLRVGQSALSRIHSWLLPKESYEQILNVLSRASELTYINPKGEFMNANTLKGSTHSQRARPTDRQKPPHRSNSTLPRLERVSESSLPPV